MIDFLIKLFNDANPIKSTDSLYSFQFKIENHEDFSNLVILNPSNIRENGVNIFEDDLKIGGAYDFDLAWTRLRKHGFYITCEDFINNNKKETKEQFYIKEIDSKKNESNFFVKNYLDVIEIIFFLNNLSDIKDEENIIFSENKYLKLSIYYNENILKRHEFLYPCNFINEFLEDYNKSSSEIKTIFKNELIDFLKEKNNNDKFVFLIENFEDYYKRSKTSYEYYLTNFSFNKIKTELDNAVLDFSKNICSVINDSQNRLIAIPAAILLTALSLNLLETFDFKNFVILISAIIFSFLLHLFILNQFSALKIIGNNIKNYKHIYIKNNDKEVINLQALITNQFVDNEKELSRQKCWLRIICIINWLIPISLFIILYFYTIHNITF